MKIREVKLNKAIEILIYIFLFLLPWQTRLMYKIGELNGGVWEYGTLSLYGTEILMWIIILLFAFYKFNNKKFWLELKQKSKQNKNKTLLFFVCYLLFLILYSGVLINSLVFDIALQWTVWWLGAMCLGVVMIDLSKDIFGFHPDEGRDLINGYSKNRGILPRCKIGVDCCVQNNSLYKDNSIKNNFLVALWLGGVVQGIFALYQFVAQKTFAFKWLGLAYHDAFQPGASVIEVWGNRFIRSYGSFGWPNSLGTYLAVIFIIGLIIYFKTKNSRFKIFITAGQLFILTGLILSFSRGAWLACLIGILFFIFIYFQSSSLSIFQSFKKIYLQFVYYLILILILVSVLFPFISARFNFENNLESRSVNERIEQYKSTKSIFKSSNLSTLLFGIGPGNYTYQTYLDNPELKSWQYQPVHNIYLLALSELGLVGTLLYCCIVILLIRQIWKYNKLNLPILSILFIAGMFDHWLFSLYTGMVLFWIILALSLKNMNVH